MAKGNKLKQNSSKMEVIMTGETETLKDMGLPTMDGVQ